MNQPVTAASAASWQPEMDELAERGEIIDPRDTKPLPCQFANMAAPLRIHGQSVFTMRP